MSIKFFVYHDSEGNITAVTNEKRSSGDFIQAEESEVKDFLTGVKDFTKFKIHSLSSGNKTIKLSSDNSGLVYKDFYILSKSQGNEDVIITHNSLTKSWNINVNSKELYEFNFFLTKIDNLNFLVRNIKVDSKKFLSIPFELEVEENIENLIILTKKVYKSYGINYA